MTLIVTWLWQGLAIAWITAAAVRAMPRLNAATRHAIWWLALAAVMAIPVAHWLAAIAPGAPSAPGPTPLDVAGALVLPAIPHGVVICAAAIWALTAAVGMLRIARSCRAVGRLKRAAAPFDRSREARLPLWVAARDSDHRAHRGHRVAELRTSDCMTGACALGLGRPVILLSRSMTDALSDDSLDEIVMHEQAHLDRYDDWSQLLLAVVGSIARLHPAVRFLARRLDVDREAACDDRVVSCSGDARRYASSLLTVAALSNPEAGAVFAAGVPTATTTASALRVRVGRLLDPGRDRGARVASATSLVSVTALALAVVISTLMTPVVIFLDTGAVNAPAAAVMPAIEMRQEPQPRINTVAGARELEQPPRRTLAHLKRPAPADPPEAAAHPFPGTIPDARFAAPDNIDNIDIGAADTVGTTLDALPAAPDNIDNIDIRAAVVLVPRATLPSSRPAVIASATPDAAPWDTVRTSTVSAATDVARAASETGARVWNKGVSIGRFVARASKAGAKAF
jgi:beta-lactamase regulating signal transducer with metallopeptidase domain